MDTTIERVICEVLDQYPVKRAALFGSAARGEITAQSDIDILVEFLPVPIGLLYFGMWDDLEKALKRKVDLLTYGSLLKQAHPVIRENALRDERQIYERAL